MKNQKVIWGVVIAIIIIVVIIFAVRGSSSPAVTSTTGTPATTGTGAATDTTVPYVTAAQVAQVSANTKKYENDELGFSVDYPSAWGFQDSATGPIFSIPTAAPATAAVGGKTSILTLQSAIYYVPSACSFPPIATSSITDRSSVTAGGNTFKMIKVNSTQGSMSYSDAMYTLQQGTATSPICYVFSFASTAATPASQNVASAQVSAVSANNQSVVAKAMTDFTSMVKSFAVVTGPAGQSESAHPTGK